MDIEQYRALVEQAPTMVWRSGLDAKRDYVNAVWLAFTGRSQDEELGDGWAAGIHPDDVDARLAMAVGCGARCEAFELEYRLRRHDGEYRYVLDRGAPYRDAHGAFVGFIGTCLDVDDRRRRRDALADEAEFFDMSLDNLCVVGFDGYFRRINPSWVRTLGWTVDELMARPTDELVHPDDAAATKAACAGVLAGAPLLALTNRYRCRDGTYRWFEWRSIAHVDRDLVYAAARDVTEQRDAQRALGELTASLATTLNSIADGVISTGADSAVTGMNPVAEKLTGWNVRDARGRPLQEVFNLVDAHTRRATATPVERTLRGGVAVELTAHTLLVGRDGTELPIAVNCAPMRDADGTVCGAVLVFRDQTAERNAADVQERLQRQLIVAERMASVGTLAAGVAHEINNPLAYVLANLEMLVNEMAEPLRGQPSPELTEWTQMAIDAQQGAEKIRKIVRGLKTFSRAEEERRSIIDVRPVLEVSINMAFNEIRHRARLVREFGDAPLVEADDARLGQVFINLLVNAAQALPEGGAEENEIRVVTSRDATGRAVIEVRDTGTGIPEAMLGRVFDPFFTTKPVGVGTGLGLFICHSIVTGLGGEITASNRPGGGTVFRVALPGVADHRHESHAAAAAEPRGSTGRASVLIVDDDRAVSVTLGRVLREHHVTLTATAAEALDLLDAGASFDVILSDLMMPEMSGMDLYNELVRRHPRAAEHMVFITGGAFTPAAKAFLARVPNERLTKPFDAGAVRALIRRFVK